MPSFRQIIFAENVLEVFQSHDLDDSPLSPFLSSLLLPAKGRTILTFDSHSHSPPTIVKSISIYVQRAPLQWRREDESRRPFAGGEGE